MRNVDTGDFIERARHWKRRDMPVGRRCNKPVMSSLRRGGLEEREGAGLDLRHLPALLLHSLGVLLLPSLCELQVLVPAPYLCQQKDNTVQVDGSGEVGKWGSGKKTEDQKVTRRQDNKARWRTGSEAEQ